MISIESAAALGTTDGRDFAKRHISAVLIPGIGTPVAAAEREVIQQLWIDKQIADHSERRLDLACRGAGLDALEAYTRAREIAFVEEMHGFVATMDALTKQMEEQNAALAQAGNRTARRKAKSVARSEGLQ